MKATAVKILLVEDSPSDADVLQEMLHQTGPGSLEFTWVKRLEEAFARLRGEAFDVLLLDLSLPDSTGPDTYLRARQVAPQLPIVVLTGGNDEAIGLEAVRQGVQDYLVKGRADSSQVARAIRYAIERQRAEQALRQAHDHLEQRVAERTVELRSANEELRIAMAEQRRLEAEILEASNRERQRIGQDLHDGLTQQISGILYLSEALRRKLEQHLELKPVELSRITELLADAATQARSLAHGLNPVGVEPEGFMLALKNFASTVQETFKISCRLESSQPILLQDNAVATHLYRIAQEAVQNAIKHGNATRVRMRLQEVDHQITFEVRDNGVGLINLSENHSGMGLRIMRYRAHACGGNLSIRPGPRGGVCVICSVPRTALKKGTAP